ncbi:hypothetical protein Pelo_18900 [Pelomyxa schiedti]|nr:hypothetical protein Pelo_18900 [Pelomyxa schiedti]
MKTHTTHPQLLLCGNKADIVDQESSVTHCTGHMSPEAAEGAVTYAQGLAFARANHCDGFIEVSAKTMKNIPELLAAFGLLALEGAPPAKDRTYPLGRANKKKETGSGWGRSLARPVWDPTCAA